MLPRNDTLARALSRSKGMAAPDGTPVTAASVPAGPGIGRLVDRSFPNEGLNLHSMLVEGKDASHIDGLDDGFRTSLRNMVRSAPPEIRNNIRMNSGYRSPEHQARLWKNALAEHGSPAAARKWVAPPGRSYHNRGQAMDLRYLDPAAREWVHANAKQYGLYFPMAHEPWHIEPIGTRSGGGSAATASAAPTSSTGADMNPLTQFPPRPPVPAQGAAPKPQGLFAGFDKEQFAKNLKEFSEQPLYPQRPRSRAAAPQNTFVSAQAAPWVNTYRG